MEDNDVLCEECGVAFSRLVRVDQFLVNAHTREFEKVKEICPSCAASEEKRKTVGEAETWALEFFTQAMERHYGNVIEVRWIQGDEHRWLFHVRRTASLPCSGSGV